MKTGIIILAGAIITLASFTTKKEKELQVQVTERSVAVADSVFKYQIQNLVYNQVVMPLGDCGKLKTSLEFMDKSGHRTKVVVDQVGYDLRNENNQYVMLDEQGEAYGDLEKIDGNFRSHICSFKVDYKNKKVYARSSVLEDWLPAEKYVQRVKKS